MKPQLLPKTVCRDGCWNGGLVAVRLSDRNEWMVAYDKGLLATYTDEQLLEDYSEEYIKLQTEVGGLINNSRVDYTVAEIMWHKNAG